MESFSKMDKLLNKGTVSYNSIKNDPQALLLLINKYVEVKTKQTFSFTGFIHSIDPLSYSIFLLVPKEDSYQVVLIPGHSIDEIIELVSKTTINIIQSSNAVIPNPVADLKERKKKVINWLTSNLLPAIEDGDNIIVGDASLLPPYTLEDICASKPIIALQMRKNLINMPPDL